LKPSVPRIRPTSVKPSLLIFAAAMLAASRAYGQGESATPVMTTVVVPIVGSTIGIDNVRWRTNVELRNESGSAATVVITLPTAADQPTILLPAIPPGGVVRFADIVGQAFNLDLALSPLIVQTEGRRSVTIRATVYGVRGGEALPPQPIPISYVPTFFPQRTLQGLSFSDDFRTNIGLANLSEKDVPFTLALQRVPGRNVAVAHITLPPSSLWHASIQTVFPLITNGDNFTVVVETGNPETYVYASVIENGTDVARFVSPMIIGGSAIR
jgi:hypothetical protein